MNTQHAPNVGEKTGWPVNSLESQCRTKHLLWHQWMKSWQMMALKVNNCTNACKWKWTDRLVARWKSNPLLIFCYYKPELGLVKKQRSAAELEVSYSEQQNWHSFCCNLCSFKYEHWSCGLKPCICMSHMFNQPTLYRPVHYQEKTWPCNCRYTSLKTWSKLKYSYSLLATTGTYPGEDECSIRHN